MPPASDPDESRRGELSPVVLGLPVLNAGLLAALRAARLPAFLTAFPLALLAGLGTAHAQETRTGPHPSADTLVYATEVPVVVTATRSGKALDEVAVPMEVVGADELTRTGRTRLDQALVSLNGMALFDDHGAGIQMQGLSPDYTLILIDGEPVIGRNAGTLDLRRLSLNGVDRVEVVRGPTSSLYGSDALAGVVNLITARAADGLQGGVSVRTGTHASHEFHTELSHGGERHGVRLTLGRRGSDGYDLDREQFGLTSPAFTDQTADLRARLDVGERWGLELGARGSLQDQEGRFSIRSAGLGEQRYDERGGRREWSVNPKVVGRLESGLRVSSSVYLSGYGTEVEHVSREDGSILYADSFDQFYSKAEQQVTKLWNERHLSVGGAGVVRERLGGDRYGSGSEAPLSTLGFVYLQHEWIPGERLQVGVSGRFDAHSDYAARLSPKVSVMGKPWERLRLRASVGTGFKAPAFRQLHLSFSNSIAGYSVFGSTELRDGIRTLRGQGQIAQTFLDVERLEQIRAEHAVSYNVGLTLDSRDGRPGSWSLRLDGFHNEVSDMIEIQPVAQKTNGQFVYSYFNLAEIYTRGMQAGMRWGRKLPKGMRVEIDGGVQLLQARDRQVLREIDSGRVFGRNEAGRDYKIGRSDYSGLFGRSTGMGTLQAGLIREAGGDRATSGLRREESSVIAQARWRSRFGYRDLDGNGFANQDREFVPAHWIAGFTLNQRFTHGNGWAVDLQAGAENLLGVTFPDQIPSLSGRLVHVTASFSF